MVGPLDSPRDIPRDGLVTFLPHRLNRHPVVVRGLTADELWVCAGLSAAAGFVAGVPLAWLTHSIAMVPTLIVVGIGVGVGVFVGGDCCAGTSAVGPTPGCTASSSGSSRCATPRGRWAARHSLGLVDHAAPAPQGQCGDLGLRLGHQIDRQEPRGWRQSAVRHDRARGQRRLAPTRPALPVANPHAGEFTGVGATAARAAKITGPACPDQCRLTLHLRPIRFHELRQRQPLLKLARRLAIAAPFHGGRRGHPVGFARQWYDALQALYGDEGARFILRAESVAITRIDVDDPGRLLGVYTPHDIERMLGSRPPFFKDVAVDSSGVDC